MKHYFRTLAWGAAVIAAIAVGACGGKQTMASKSAAAYDEAKKKGIPIEAGEHGGHSAEAGAEPTATDHAAMPGMDHGAMAGMDHSKMPGMQRGASGAAAHDMAGMNHSGMAGMDHSKMPGMQHGASGAAAHNMAGMDHSAMAGMDHSKMPGMQHGTATAAPIVIAPPTSNAAIAQTQPAATLRADEFDAPASTAIQEAAKGASGMSHSMDATPKSPPPPQPPSKHDHHGEGAS